MANLPTYPLITKTFYPLEGSTNQSHFSIWRNTFFKSGEVHFAILTNKFGQSHKNANNQMFTQLTVTSMKFLIIEKMPGSLKIFLMENPTLTFAHLPWILLVMAYSIFPDCPASILCLFYGEVCIRIGERGPGRRLIQYISVAKSKQSWLDL